MARPSDCASLDLQLERASFAHYTFTGPCMRQILEQAVSHVFPVTADDLWSDKRGSPDAAHARQVAMYLAYVACGLTMREVGKIFARDRTTVAHACGLIEDSRDNPMLDRSLDLLEGVLRSLAAEMAVPRRRRITAH